MSLDIARVAARVLLTYITLMTLLRLGGKRSLDSSTPFVFMFSLIVGDMLDDMLWMTVSLPKGIVAVGALVALHLLSQLLMYHFPVLSRLFEGRPVVIVRDGRPAPPGLMQERISRKELDELIRSQGRIPPTEMAREIDQAQLEVNGQLSVQRRPDARPTQKRDRDRLEGL